MTRTRSEYRLDRFDALPAGQPLDVRQPVGADRDELAALLLDAYRGTIDDEGEDLADAAEAIDQYLKIIRREHSVVVLDDVEIVAMSFVVVVDDVHYIDPVAVAPSHQHRRIGRDAVVTCLRSLAVDGAACVGATITDGNVASERLFGSLGYRRVGQWG